MKYKKKNYDTAIYTRNVYEMTRQSLSEVERKKFMFRSSDIHTMES